MSSPHIWRNSILPLNSTIRDAVNVLNDTALKIVLIADEFGVLVGTVSDGDIRRGLLEGLNLGSSIDRVTHRNALVVNSETNDDEVKNLMIKNRIHQIPIVDNKNHIIGLHLWDEISAPKIFSNTLLIMAGGRGTRLYPQTENCPKPLLPIAGKPILEYIIERAKAEGFSNFVIAVHYLAEMIEDYFGNGAHFGVSIKYLREESPLGTAGALTLLDPLPATPIVVTNGDVLTDIHYGEILNYHHEKKSQATMAIRIHEFQNPFGVVELKGYEISHYKEKPILRSYINAGVYVLDSLCIELLAKSQYCDMSTLFETLIQSNVRVTAYPTHEKWLDIGRPADFQEAQLTSEQKVETQKWIK